MDVLRERLVRFACRVYAVMLHAYPPAFHAHYGAEMVRVFRQRIRDDLGARGVWIVVPLMLGITGDWMKTVVQEHLAADRGGRVVATGLGLVPAVAFVVTDFVLQLPDNHHEPTWGFFVTLFILISIWTLSGFFAPSEPSDWRRAMAAGAASGILSVAVLAAVFVVLNNLFPVRMSYEPDRLRAFSESGYATLRTYINRQLVLSGFFPALATVAAILGSTGGGLRTLMARWSATA